VEVIFRDKKGTRIWNPDGRGLVAPASRRRFLRRDTHHEHRRRDAGATRPYSSNHCGYLNARPLTTIDGNTMFHCGGMCS